MSKTPKYWLEKIIKYADVVIFHLNIEDDIDELISYVKRHNKKVGLCLGVTGHISEIQKYLPELDEVMLLSIPKPGASGQKFDYDTLTKIEALNKHSLRENFTLSVDGGVNDQVISLYRWKKLSLGHMF